jgi:hypothetical protein
MSISIPSFWQQDQIWRGQQQSLSQQLNDTASLTSVLTTALTNQTSGLAGIANKQALDRVNSEISAAQQSDSSASTSSTSSASPASGGATNTADSVPTSSAVDLQSGTTAATLLSGEIPSGSLLSFLA